MQEKNISSELLDFLKEELLGSDSARWSIESDTSLLQDLGVSGIDAENFILSFSQRFNVDISEFKILDYFPAEVSFFKIRKIKPFLVRDLEQAISSKKLL